MPCYPSSDFLYYHNLNCQCCHNKFCGIILKKLVTSNFHQRMICFDELFAPRTKLSFLSGKFSFLAFQFVISSRQCLHGVQSVWFWNDCQKPTVCICWALWLVENCRVMCFNQSAKTWYFFNQSEVNYKPKQTVTWHGISLDCSTICFHWRNIKNTGVCMQIFHSARTLQTSVKCRFFEYDFF